MPKEETTDGDLEVGGRIQLNLKKLDLIDNCINLV
jgi:hypothetical protein